MRQMVIHLSSPTHIILSLYHLFSTRHSLFFLSFLYSDSVTARIPNPSLDTARASRSPLFASTLCLLLCCRRSVPSRPSRRHARVLPLYCALIVHTLSSLVLSKHTTITVQSDSAIEPIALLSVVSKEGHSTVPLHRPREAAGTSCSHPHTSHRRSAAVGHEAAAVAPRPQPPGTPGRLG